MGELDDLLTGREGWRTEDDNGRPIWRYGRSGAAIVTISETSEGFVISQAKGDREDVLRSVHEVRAWLDSNEPPLEVTGLQGELLEALPPDQRERWRREKQGGG